ncbi:butyrate kinase [Rickettsiales bacterium LUAb2]
MKTILVINPGSTSTKISVFNDQQEVFTNNISHSVEDLSIYNNIIEQYGYRKNIILQNLHQNKFNLKDFKAVVGRGGLIRPLKGGTYAVNDLMLQDLKVGILGEHASNLGGILAYDIAKDYHLPSFIVDPVVVDEMEPIARISGFKGIDRVSIFHALNQKSVAREIAKKLNKTYENCNFIVVHMGGGISVGVHKQGLVVDVNNALDGEGPFSPERSGGLPLTAIIDFCLQHKDQTKKQILKNFVGQGGLVSYLGTNSGIEVTKRIQNGDLEAELIFKAMAYQIAKEIGAGLTVLKGDCDSIILTGGLAHQQQLVSEIKSRIEFTKINIEVLAGENEMKSLAFGALRVLNNLEVAKEYI